MPRFVLLSHDWPSPHYDLMLEHAGVLRTWRLSTLPPSPAEHLADHRLHYLDYEGPVSGDRGCVTRIDSGEYSGFPDSDITSVELRGSRLIGRLIIANSYASFTPPADMESECARSE